MDINKIYPEKGEAEVKKILFLIHDLGQGGAEKVLINLVNNMDYSQFDVTVMTLFDHGENRQFLRPEITYKTWCRKMVRGNSHLMKLFTPEQLHRMIIKEHYDIEVAYLEGPCARVISGCEDKNTKLVSWIHIQQGTTKRASVSFRNSKEAMECYNKFHKIICVSKAVEKDFKSILNITVPTEVLYNTNESEKIILASKEHIQEMDFSEHEIKLIGVGKLLKNKGFHRLLQIVDRLVKDQVSVHLYILGDGPEKENLQNYIKGHGLESNVTLLGYQLNPYKYVAKCDLFVCASYAEGFSTAATEALIVGIPVCTVDVSGMKEMLGENNEYGIITDNEDEALYQGLKKLLEQPKLLTYYTKQAEIRGKNFNTKSTVNAVENMFEKLFI